MAAARLGAPAAIWDVVLAAVACLECIPYSKPRDGTRRTQKDGGAVAVEEGVAADFDLPASTTNFDARPFLTKKTMRALRHPDSALLEEAEVPAWVDEPRRAAPLGRALRRYGRLTVFPEETVDPRDTSEVFGVLKKVSSEGRRVVRQIVHRKRRNLRAGAALGLRRDASCHASLLSTARALAGSSGLS